MVSKGALAVSLLHMVGDQQEEKVKVMVGMSTGEQLGEVFVMDAGKGCLEFKDSHFKQTV